ncbi:hypothetical protein SAMN05444008_103249 [Cnuella takakiae]|uniref:Peptidase S12 Pab87-related C-terminal domain-containing protein n=1 Tax=Cnuella takakiae TaxID=1302690 RepID=A0A1M4X4W1_9BACT|nr:hypothetical protein [Cnuella takakiae]OLY91532.1 hypothetical protein BUE76_06155 [Cnuella takakiae]SHE88499.1 hypothetical protein SAMN05444008_103249 [Cnuella takakiae]
MKRVLFLSALLLAVGSVFAQTKDTALTNYVGKYTFPEGSFVTAAEISMQGNVLSVSSTQGGSVLEKQGVDTFTMKEFEGSRMVFFRNKEGKVARIKVEVDDILLEGAKEGVPTAWLRPFLTDDRKNKQAR